MLLRRVFPKVVPARSLTEVVGKGRWNRGSTALLNVEEIVIESRMQRCPLPEMEKVVVQDDVGSREEG